jgi:serine phosphatase RsbU (regulator of sigma subunit)
MFGAERLQSILEHDRAETIDIILHRVETSVMTFRGSAEPFDDATMMALRIS